MASLLRLFLACGAAGAILAGAATACLASTSIVLDVDSGAVLYQDGATTPWYPASTTKLMTVYVALSAVREGRITLDTPLMVSSRAAAMQPSKMGFRPGTLVTLDNALKMLMVKSPNDVAVTIAEGVGGSVEAFADDMNVYATRLGLHESHFVNPNGLPDSRHVSSARDMAMIGRALLHDFPEQKGLFGIGVLEFGGRLINNHNGMLGRYPGADGMKTGFTCAAGYNLVASAERDGHHLITVVMGAPSTKERNERAAALFDRFFATGGSSLGQPDSLPSSGITTPVDNHATVCGRGRYAAVAEAEAEDGALTLAAANQPERNILMAMAGQAGTVPAAVAGTGMSATRAAFEPVHVFVGPVPGWNGRVAQAIGGGKEYGRAPVRQAAAQERAAPPPDGGSPIESAAPSPAPLALLGATPVAPAALAAKRLVRGAPALSLAVASVRKAGHGLAQAGLAKAGLGKALIKTAAATPAVKPDLKKKAAKAKKP